VWINWYAPGEGKAVELVAKFIFDTPSGLTLRASGDRPAPSGPDGVEPSLVELHIRFGTECGKNCIALLLGQAAEIEPIMIPQELCPLRSGRARLSVHCWTFASTE